MEVRIRSAECCSTDSPSVSLQLRVMMIVPSGSWCIRGASRASSVAIPSTSGCTRQGKEGEFSGGGVTSPRGSRAEAEKPIVATRSPSRGGSGRGSLVRADNMGRC